MSGSSTCNRTHTDLLSRLASTFNLRGTLVHTESRSVALSVKYLNPLRSGWREAQRIEGDVRRGSQFQSDHTEADGHETAISNLTKTGISRCLYILVRGGHGHSCDAVTECSS